MSSPTKKLPIGIAKTPANRVIPKLLLSDGDHFGDEIDPATPYQPKEPHLSERMHAGWNPTGSVLASSPSKDQIPWYCEVPTFCDVITESPARMTGVPPTPVGPIEKEESQKLRPSMLTYSSFPSFLRPPQSPADLSLLGSIGDSPYKQTPKSVRPDENDNSNILSSTYDSSPLASRMARLNEAARIPSSPYESSPLAQRMVQLNEAAKIPSSPYDPSALARRMVQLNEATRISSSPYQSSPLAQHMVRVDDEANGQSSPYKSSPLARRMLKADDNRSTLGSPYKSSPLARRLLKSNGKSNVQKSGSSTLVEDSIELAGAEGEEEDDDDDDEFEAIF